jgi:hypothetical protein
MGLVRASSKGLSQRGTCEELYGMIESGNFMMMMKKFKNHDFEIFLAHVDNRSPEIQISSIMIFYRSGILC